jgi:hypothetical protein
MYCRAARSALGSAQDFHELGHLLLLLGFAPAGDGMADTMVDVIAQDLLLDASQGCANGGNLRDDVDAVAVFLDHASKAADLTLDAIEALQA